MKAVRIVAAPALAFVLLFLTFIANANAESVSPKILSEKPKLVLVVVFDQFRADYLTRFTSRFLPAKQADGSVGGFRYLMSNGAYFPYGQYDMLQDMTGPGHLTIMSGSYPYQSGVPLNNWYNAKQKSQVYCAENPDIKVVDEAGGKQDPHFGTSPKNTFADTLGDELKNAGYHSKVVTVALKDRSAIFMGGHRADAAVWMNPNTGMWVSSLYYFPDNKLPAWVRSLNEGLKAKKGTKYQWNAGKTTTGLTSDDTLPSLDKKLGEVIGAAFPHSFEMGSKASFSTPYGLEVTEEAAEKAIDFYQLGKGAHPDLLAVSFSSHDYMGHAFGPNRAEMEEMTVADDKALAKLLNRVNKTVPGGLKNVVVVLTADHGVAPNPEWIKKTRTPGGKLDEKKLLEKLESELAGSLGKPKGGKYIAGHIDLNFWLAPEAFESGKPNKTQVAEALKTALLSKIEGIAFAFTQSDYEARRLPPGILQRQILKTYYPGRSGDVIAIPRPFYTTGEDTTTHMTGYTYDRTVPIIFSGAHIKAGTVHANFAEVVDIVPTLSFMLGTIAPNMAEGRVLGEIFQGGK